MSAFPSKSNVLWYNKPSSVWEIWPSACIHQLALNGFWATMFKVVCLCSFSFSFLCNHMLGLRKDTCPLVNVPVLSLWSAMRWWVTSQKKQTNEEEHCLFLALTWECDFFLKHYFILCFKWNYLDFSFYVPDLKGETRPPQIKAYWWSKQLRLCLWYRWLDNWLNFAFLKKFCFCFFCTTIIFIVSQTSVSGQGIFCFLKALVASITKFVLFSTIFSETKCISPP